MAGQGQDRTALTLGNGRLVLGGQVIAGGLSVAGGLITAIEPGRQSADHDLDGDLLIPGIIDLHTDNLERQVQPRPNARWPSRSALIAHDAQCAVAGVTTVYDSLCVGDIGFEEDRKRTLIEGVADLDALEPTGLLKSEHLLHLRCELPAEDMEEELAMFLDNPRLRLASLMDHTPGIGQWGDVALYRASRARDGLSEAEIDRRFEFLQAQRGRWRGPNRDLALAAFRARGIPIASHDDRLVEEVAENHRDGIGIAEFPVSLAAAEAAHGCGMGVIAGAPNLVRGGSHSGNVAAADLLRAGVVDAFASDYVPSSLIEAAILAAGLPGMDLPRAIGLVTAAPAAMAGLADRGRLEAGLRADLVQVRLHEGLPIIRAVWRQGQRVA